LQLTNLDESAALPLHLPRRQGVMRVLIVDGDLGFCAALEHDLQSHGHSVLVTAGFESMVDVLLKVTPHAAIVDAHLPYGESRHVAMVLRRCGVPVILLAEHDGPTNAVEESRIVVDVTLMEPVDLTEILRHLNRLRSIAH
jgi:DNA-binding response OmpR family regulator